MPRGPSAVGHRTSWWRLGALALVLAGTAWLASCWITPFHPQREAPQAVFLPVQSKNARDLRAGTLLVASRDLPDPNFARTVILLVKYDADGVVGLILNRPTDVPLSRALEGQTAKSRADPVYLGGPVETSAVFTLLRSPSKVEGGEPILGGVYLIVGTTLLERTLSARPDPSDLHVYLGYAGWTKEQLRKETELGAWFIFQADAGSVFDSNPDSLWPRMIRKTEQRFAGTSPANQSLSRDAG
jgi:putative AlgH/UPF0301 family transcriptional regulator